MEKIIKCSDWKQADRNNIENDSKEYECFFYESETKGCLLKFRECKGDKEK